MNWPEVIYIATCFIVMFLFVFITQFILIFKFKNINNQRLDEFEKRIADSERLVRSQVDVNNEVLKMTNSINALIKEKQKSIV